MHLNPKTKNTDSTKMADTFNGSFIEVNIGGTDPIDMDCFSPLMIYSNGVWFGNSSLKYSLPALFIQILLITVTGRIIYAILRPLNVPRVTTEVLSGVFLGPSVVGKLIPFFQKMVFPQRTHYLLSSLGNLGILYYSFMIGVEIDATLIRKLTKKIISVGAACLLLPFIVTFPVCHRFRTYFREQDMVGAFYIYVVISMSMTSFPVLARILSDHKLLSSEIGRVSLLASMLGELGSWVLLAFSIGITGASEGKTIASGITLPPKPITTHLILFYSIGFVLCCVYLVQPAFRWLVSKTPEGEQMSDMDLGIVIMGVMLAGFICDFIGVHHVFGAFVFGLVIPSGPQATQIVEKFNDILTGFLVPIYFAISGLKFDIFTIETLDLVWFFILLTILAIVSKFLAAVVVGLAYQMPYSESLSLGILMNFQGLMRVVIVNLARQDYIVTKETFALFLLSNMFVTASLPTILHLIYKSSRKMVTYDCRTILETDPHAPMSIFACVHASNNIQSILTLLDISNPRMECPIKITALHLVELSGRASAMVIHHESELAFELNDNSMFVPQSKSIVAAFENYERRTEGVVAQTVTSIASYSDMHNDVCNLAAEKHATIIILPFDKAQSVLTKSEDMDATSLAIRDMNLNVIKQPPCSIAILMDRGVSKKNNKIDGHNVVVIFFGGPDDREAIAYAYRMSGNPMVHLTVIRFIAGEKTVWPTDASASFSEYNELLSHTSQTEINLEIEQSLAMDEGYMQNFKMVTSGNQLVEYIEKVVNNVEETVAELRAMDVTYDLYIVGRSQGVCPLTVGLGEWMERAELGPLGDLLASTELGESKSLLVVQQYSDKAFESKGTVNEKQQDAFM